MFTFNKKIEFTETEAKKYLLDIFLYEQKDIKSFYTYSFPISLTGLVIFGYLRSTSWFATSSKWWIVIPLLIFSAGLLLMLYLYFIKKEHIDTDKIVEIINGDYDLLDSLTISKVDKLDDYNKFIGKQFQLNFSFSDTQKVYVPEKFSFLSVLIEDDNLEKVGNETGKEIVGRFMKIYHAFNTLIPNKVELTYDAE